MQPVCSEHMVSVLKAVVNTTAVSPHFGAVVYNSWYYALNPEFY